MRASETSLEDAFCQAVPRKRWETRVRQVDLRGTQFRAAALNGFNPTPKVRGQKGRLQLFLLPCMFFACEKMLFEICTCNIWVVNLTSSHLCPRGLALSRGFYRSSFGTLISSPSWCWAHTWCSTSNGTFFAATGDLHAYTHRIHVWYIC